VQRGEHDIEDELIFTKHDGYVFHDSRGFESGNEEELEIVQEFVRRRSQERSLNNRLHAIWFGLLLSLSVIANSHGLLFRYCVPMDNDRPSLDLKHFDKIFPDENTNGMSKHNFVNWRITYGFF
jgi:hypothetical protein